MTATSLLGMTWSHPRGYDPMVACSRDWKQRTGVEIKWDKRSLQDFESYPVETLARRYDLIVIDHPHVGEVTEQNCLLPLDRDELSREALALREASIGGSYESYTWDGRQWALPIDAAAQVQAYRADLLDSPVRDWSDAARLARDGRAFMPMRPPHSLMVLFTIAANLGTPCAAPDPHQFIDTAAGIKVYDLIAEFMTAVPERAYTMDPIAVLEEMCAPQSSFACAPLIYGYVPYGVEGFRHHRVTFADIPVVGQGGPRGSALGGTGIAVSAFSQHPDEAVRFAYWIAGQEVQAGVFADAGGQPAHRSAWESGSVNAATNGFYSGTRATLDGAWTRPRHAGYMGFQAAASERLNQGLMSEEAADRVISELNSMFTESFR